ncbi:amidase [Colletotrichum plurivorum]|uniref:Amidase n=1 Tax=Colletotrichum plurivorum TaxID=2175906 RepID=A0A8H6JS81_9PEZI|nr:amidase [Colletotrichum plurivorum]
MADPVETSLELLRTTGHAMKYMCIAGIASAMAVRHPVVLTQAVSDLDRVFQLGNQSYLATSASVLMHEPLGIEPTALAATHIVATTPLITGQYLQDTIERYLATDYVFSEDFLQVILVSSNHSSTVDTSARNLIESLRSRILQLPATPESVTLPPGPILLQSDGSTRFSRVSRLYTDVYSTFVSGIYESNGTYKPLNLVDPAWGHPMIPLPSRLYSEGDPRPLAGARVGVKDIYDVAGLRTALGSKAWARMVSDAETTAPSIQRVVDLGGVLVGKQKTSQFASGALAWEWTDVYHPQNPRGDGCLSCSASSAGGACSIAGYDWLDFAIGSDTGQSVRQPAAFAGVYGNRPSQGIMNLDGVMPISHGTDTAGVFARDPRQLAKFARAWYTPSLHQGSDMNGLTDLHVPSTGGFPKRILYPVDQLPLRNPAAEAVLQGFLDRVTKATGMTVEKINATAKVESVTGRSYESFLADLGTLWRYTQLKVVGKPLLDFYSPNFPIMELPFRSSWKNSTLDHDEHDRALQRRRRDSDAWHEEVLFGTEDSCSEAIMIYDIGTGGLPSFREEYLNDGPDAAIPEGPGTRRAGSTLASFLGSADYTVPIGQVSYYSKVTHQEHSLPVTINMMVKRGCDFVLFDFIEELADKGILVPVSTGRKTFV